MDLSKLARREVLAPNDSKIAHLRYPQAHVVVGDLVFLCSLERNLRIVDLRSHFYPALVVLLLWVSDSTVGATFALILRMETGEVIVDMVSPENKAFQARRQL